MDFKLSISILVSSAYFLALLIVNILKTGNILSTLLMAMKYAVILFFGVYLLLLYIYYAFENLRKKESQDALEHIKRIENEFKRKQRDELDNRLKELREQENNNFDEDDYEAPFINNLPKHEEEEIKKLKRDSGTQFDTSFIKDGGPSI